ncbi:MAG: protein TolR [Deltaproteobacteria bacterium]|nr:MAG: protein TolR [Deltaproteobacteria bacterium]
MGMQGEHRGRSALSEINVTPFVDVMLVLLVIFMVTAPLIQQGIPVDLPKAKAESLTFSEEALIVTVTKEGEVFVEGPQGRIAVTLSTLAPTLEELLAVRQRRDLFLKGDREVPYGRIIEVMSTLRRAGIQKIGMITEPERKR